MKINKSAAEVRKTWLVLTAILGALDAVLTVAISDKEPYKIMQQSFVNQAVWFYILYYCAYKKHGNGLLTCWLLLGSVWRVFFWAHCLDDCARFQVPAFILTEIGVYMWWYSLSSKLLRINKNLMFRASSPVEVFYE